MNKEITQRLALLRQEMKKINADAFYFSGTDPHHSEYLADHWKAIPYFSGFTGSAASMIVTQDTAALWTDSRYFIQAEAELQGTGIELQRLRVDALSHTEWISNQLNEGQIATDLTCLTVQEYQDFSDDWFDEEANYSLPYRFIDGGECLNKAWANRPAIPANPIFEHEDKYCGLTRSEKIANIREHQESNHNATGVFLTALDEIAWTFNLRGSDIAYNPVFLSYAFIDANQVVLIVQKDSLSPELEAKLRSEDIEIADYNNLSEALSVYGAFHADPHATPVSLDPFIATAIAFSTNTSFYGEEEHLQIDPIHVFDYADSLVKSMKAIKTAIEVKHIGTSMCKDGVAMVKFLYWLKKNIGSEKVFTEYELVDVLNGFRKEQNGFIGNSFYPIMSFKANGAIVHRAVTKDNTIPIEGNGLLLFDSGGQYLDGTTDITRTISIGTPTAEERRDFTLVLKGVIALSEAKFPAGTLGCHLDTLARQALWQYGLNYGHGTGHGIGYFLNVHEGPQSIRQEYNPVSIKPGMVISNEPGVYKAGKYGIRIENVMVCVEAEKSEFGQFLAFKTLTLCPIDKCLIAKELLNKSEIDWINQYHQRCFQELSPFVSTDELNFLKQITETL